MPRLTYSRLIVPRKAKEDAIIGLLSLHSPLGLLEEGTDLVACFREAAAAREAKRALELFGHKSDLVTDIPEEDPLEAFRASSRPFPVGRRLWIDPGDPSDSSPPQGRLALRVPASRAFGTGSHESTRLALLALEEELLEGKRVLDVGTGSGVLAFAAVALGAWFAVGCDTDRDAICVAEGNRRRHPFDDDVFLFAGSLSAVSGTFPVVVANLLPEEMLPMKTELCAHVEPGGHLILSGIPAEREKEVVSKLPGRRRWPLAGRQSENGWVCLCLGRD